MPKWSDFGNVWTTLRELDVRAIRDEAERPVAIACIGHEAALDEIDRLLHQGNERYTVHAPSPLELIPLGRAPERAASLRGADMLLLAVDAREPLTEAEANSFARLEELTIPFLVVLVFGERRPAGDATLSPMIRARTVTIADPAAIDAADQLATAVLGRMPAEQHLAAARRLPGLRPIFARDLINNVSLTNATFAVASSLPEQIPVLSVPFVAADIVLLTKNQAIMVYRLALAYGAPPEFQERIREVLPVIGGGFLWRQVARSLVSLVPVWGVIPKVAIAYAGTYTTGVVAWRWFENGEIISTEQLKRISAEAIAIGRARAAEIVERARAARDSAVARSRAGGGAGAKLKKLVSFRRKPRELTPPKQ